MKMGICRRACSCGGAACSRSVGMWRCGEGVLEARGGGGGGECSSGCVGGEGVEYVVGRVGGLVVAWRGAR